MPESTGLWEVHTVVSCQAYACPALPAGVVRPVLELSANWLAQSICFDSVAPHRLRVTGFLYFQFSLDTPFY